MDDRPSIDVLGASNLTEVTVSRWARLNILVCPAGPARPHQCSLQ
ncbi:hypothetical protein ABZ769_34020 [Streptomyces olivoreticuli]